MKIGDLVRCAPDMYEDEYSTGLVVNMTLEWPNVEIMWKDGCINVESVELLEVINED